MKTFKDLQIEDTVYFLNPEIDEIFSCKITSITNYINKIDFEVINKDDGEIYEDYFCTYKPDSSCCAYNDFYIYADKNGLINHLYRQIKKYKKLLNNLKS